jgi:hypothetical protein
VLLTLKKSLFYSVTIIFNLLGVLFTITPVPPVLPSLMSSPNFAIENAMACLVFRGLSLGKLSDDYEDSAKLSTLRFDCPPVSKDFPRKDFPDKVHGIESVPHHPPIAVEMTQMTEFQYGKDPGENESHRTHDV